MGENLFYANKGNICQDVSGLEEMDVEEVVLKMMPGGVYSCPYNMHQ